MCIFLQIAGCFHILFGLLCFKIITFHWDTKATANTLECFHRFCCARSMKLNRMCKPASVLPRLPGIDGGWGKGGGVGFGFLLSFF